MKNHINKSMRNAINITFSFGKIIINKISGLTLNQNP